MVVLSQAITEGTTVTISLKVLATMISFAFSVAGIYWAGKGRDDRLEARIKDLEDWLDQGFNGGPNKTGGHLQTLEKMKVWYEREKGRAQGRRESRDSHSGKHPPISPGPDDTIM